LSTYLSKIQKTVKDNQHRFTLHALERIIERDIQPDEIKEALLNGEVIECYPEDKYGPSCLILGKCARKILHIQCSQEPVWIITAYDPTLSTEKWDQNLKKRKSS
jgi:hypothetical protein